MKQLNKWQTIVFLAGGALMVIGAGCFSLMFHQEVACWVFAAGALMFVAMQAEQRYDGPYAACVVYCSSPASSSCSLQH